MAKRTCRACGCTDARACQPGGCYWVEWDLCSACADRDAAKLGVSAAELEALARAICRADGCDPDELIATGHLWQLFMPHARAAARVRKEAKAKTTQHGVPAVRIPIAAARRIAEHYGQQQVILVTWDGAKTHVVTYGTTLEACEQAAAGGNRVKRALGWPKELCHAKPARQRRREAAADGVKDAAGHDH